MADDKVECGTSEVAALGGRFTPETTSVNGIILHYVRGGEGHPSSRSMGFRRIRLRITRSCRDWRSGSR